MAKSPYADVPEPLKSCLPAMFASYPKLSEPIPSSWFVWNKDTHKAYNCRMCHAQMRYEVSHFDDLVTAVPNKEELALEYLRMLIRGPFRSMSDLIKLERVGKNYYLHCLSLGKWPANVLANFCIASRAPIEFKHMLEPWAKYCESGYDPVLAFLLVYSYGADENGHLYEVRNFRQPRSNHLWLDPASSWMNILEGSMEAKSASYKTSPSKCFPTNKIWGHSKDYTKLMTMTDEQIAEFYKVPIQVYEKPVPPKKFVIPKIPPYIPGHPVGVIQVIQPHVAQLVPMQWAVEAAQPVVAMHNLEDDDDEPEDDEHINEAEDFDDDF